MKPTMTVKQIGEAMFNCEHEPMTEAGTKIMIGLSMMEKQGLDLSDIKGSFAFQVIQKRLEWFSNFRKEADFDTSETPIASDYLIAMLASQSDRVGVCVLYAAAIAAMYMKKKTTMTMQAFLEFFCDGFPTEAALNKIWDDQKIGGANSVDTNEAWYWDLDIPIYHVDTAQDAAKLLHDLLGK